MNQKIYHKIEHKKLVRDKVIDHILDKGQKCRYYIVKSKTKLLAALSKLDEEKEELIQAKNTGEIQQIGEEIGDILEVKELIESDELKEYITPEISEKISDIMIFIQEDILKSFDISDEEINQIKKRKFEEKGGYKRGIFLEWS